jgi:hypothetical protein
MATVHLGRLLGPVGFARTVAIKRLHENFARDPQFVAMFVDEARLAARIQHPNVVDMLDVITTEGELFLVLAYIHGESLATLLRIARSLECRVPVGVLAGVIIGVLHGLHAAHEARSERGEPLGIVHRDVSPHNILVGGDGIPRLLDFGVAKAAGRMQESRSGEIKGKLAYMAPEQVRGDADRRTDVYSTSVILWEGLTGRRLFRGDNDAMLVYEVLEGKVESPRCGYPGGARRARSSRARHRSRHALRDRTRNGPRARAGDRGCVGVGHRRVGRDPCARQPRRSREACRSRGGELCQPRCTACLQPKLPRARARGARARGRSPRRGHAVSPQHGPQHGHRPVGTARPGDDADATVERTLIRTASVTIPPCPIARALRRARGGRHRRMGRQAMVCEFDSVDAGRSTTRRHPSRAARRTRRNPTSYAPRNRRVPRSPRRHSADGHQLDLPSSIPAPDTAPGTGTRR